ncbi:MAG TPA: hypothetical protein PKV66_00845 [Candidatus Pelethenecus sp.]|nr:hypothetical protein [Candidatus Pelethenecus sp.]
MQEKQEFQLGDTAYYVGGDFYEGQEFILGKGEVIAIGKDGDAIYLKIRDMGTVSQQRCGHTVEEAKNIALKRWLETSNNSIQMITELKE